MKTASISDKAINVVFYIILSLLVIICFYPVWYAVLASFSDPTYINSGAIILLPKKVNFAAYRYAFAQPKLWTGYANTILYTVAGSAFGLAVSLPCGYALSRRDLPFRRIIMLILTFTMYFGGGLIPTYIVCSKLHLVNTRWILILLGSVSVYNIILIRTFCGSNIPEELREAALMDGCSNSRFFFTFVLPLSKAILAVLAIYSIVAGWLLRPEIDAVITTGGTGIAKRDVTLEAVRPLFEKEIDGFGELFRYLSFAEDVGTKAVLSRASAGSAKDKALFVLPGSTGAATLAMKRIILPEIRHIVHELTKHL